MNSTAPLLQRIADRSARIAVIGQGYVGLVVAVRAAQAGFTVIGYDVNPARVQRLRDGDSYVGDITEHDLSSVLRSTYTPTDDPTDLAGFDVAVISVPTGLRDGAPDLSHIESASAIVGAHASAGSLVILESTTYPGTTTDLVAPILERTSGLAVGDDILLGYSPERIDPGNPQFGLTNTPKVVSGIDDASLAATDAFFSAFVEKTVPVGSTGTAELVKVLENTFRHVNVALVNELAVFAHQLGVDIWEAIDAASTKPFGYTRFTPGPGVGGHCLPIDPTYLSWRVKRETGQTFRFVELANEVNETMPSYVVRRVQDLLNADRKALNGAHVVVLGLAYKPNVSDARETPAVPVIRLLAQQGATVTVVDPHVEPGDHAVLPDGVTLVAEVSPQLLASADTIVVTTNHDAFDHEAILTATCPILDTRACLPVGGSVTRL